MTKESIQFHIQSEEYFATLATILDLLRQDARHGYTKRHDEALQRLRNDLIYLQSNFRIMRRMGEPARSRRERRTPAPGAAR